MTDRGLRENSPGSDGREQPEDRTAFTIAHDSTDAARPTRQPSMAEGRIGMGIGDEQEEGREGWTIRGLYICTAFLPAADCYTAGVLTM